MLHVLTVANRSGGHFPAFLASCARFGLSPTVLAWGEPAYDGHIGRLKRLYAHLEALPADALCLFLDGWDTVVTAGEAQIVESFQAFGEGLVFAAERTCMPHPELAQRFPPCSTPYRFVNAGNWMGRADAALALWARIGLFALPDEMNDQGVLSDLYVRYPEALTLDHQCALFQNLFASEADVDWSGEPPRNVVTGTRPLIYHGSGNASLDGPLRWLGST